MITQYPLKFNKIKKRALQKKITNYKMLENEFFNNICNK